MPDGELLPDGEAVPALDEPAGDGEGDEGVLLGLVPDDGEVGGAEGEEEDGEGDGDGDFDGGCGVRLGLGVGVAVAGSGRATQEVAEFVPELLPAPALELALGLGLGLLLGLAVGLGLLVLVLLVLGLAVLGLGEAALSFAPLALAVAGNPATRPTVRELPASTLATATRSCARRMEKTALSSLLMEVAVYSSCHSEATW